MEHTVYRGIVVSQAELVRLHASVGKSVSTKRHAWWTTKQGVALTYASTAAVQDTKPGVRVVLVGVLSNYVPTTPLLPSLTGSAAVVKLVSVILL